MTFNDYRDILSQTNFTESANDPLRDFLKPQGTGDNGYGYIQSGIYHLTYTFAETQQEVAALSYGGVLGVTGYYGFRWISP